MSDLDPDSESDEPVQQTPAGATIPVPEREDVLAALRKVAEAPSERERPSDCT